MAALDRSHVPVTNRRRNSLGKTHQHDGNTTPFWLEGLRFAAFFRPRLGNPARDGVFCSLVKGTLLAEAFTCHRCLDLFLVSCGNGNGMEVSLPLHSLYGSLTPGDGCPCSAHGQYRPTLAASPARQTGSRRAWRRAWPADPKLPLALRPMPQQTSELPSSPRPWQRLSLVCRQAHPHGDHPTAWGQEDAEHPRETQKIARSSARRTAWR